MKAESLDKQPVKEKIINRRAEVFILCYFWKCILFTKYWDHH